MRIVAPENRVILKTMTNISLVILVSFSALAIVFIGLYTRSTQESVQSAANNFAHQIAKDLNDYKISKVQRAASIHMLDEATHYIFITGLYDDVIHEEGQVPDEDESFRRIEMDIEHENAKVGELSIIVDDVSIFDNFLWAIVSAICASFAVFVAGFFSVRTYVNKYVKAPLDHLQVVCDQTIYPNQLAASPSGLNPQFSLFANSFNNMQSRLAEIGTQQKDLISKIETEKQTFERFVSTGGFCFMVFNECDELEYTRGVALKKLMPDINKIHHLQELKQVMIDHSVPGRIDDKQDFVYFNDDHVVKIVMTVLGEGRTAVKLSDHTFEYNAEKSLRDLSKIEALSSMTGGIAHDFNNILATIQGNLELIASQNIKTPHAKSDYNDQLNAAYDCIKLGTQLTKRLMTYTRNNPLEVQSFSASEILNDVVSLLRGSFGAKYEFQTQFNYSGEICTDVGMFKNCVINLCINAKHAMPNGGVISIECSDKAFVKGNVFEVRVFNTSEHIPEQILSKAFDPFFTTRRGSGGSGLGLSVIQGFCFQSGGYARLENVEGGVCATIAIALIEQEKPHLQIQSIETDQIEQERKKKQSILLIDDNEMLANSLMRLLRIKGHDVDVQYSFFLPDQKYQDFVDYDVIITDNTMPGVSGFEGIQTLRKNGIHTPIILITGIESDELTDLISSMKYTSLLHKPFTTEVLLDKIDTLKNEIMKDSRSVA